GEMSLVGPRPTDFGPEDYNLWQTQRLDILPGMTGLWQITARGSVNMDERTRMDIAYIEHACISLDIYILFKTITTLLKPSGVT
ncbi:MAG TPA: sugar transferase, partial [Anaerolineales bacterium]|nr:sugar transferase [Anaerolineales bacterium]